MNEPASPPSRRARIRTIATWVIAVLAIALVWKMVPFRDRCTDAGCEPGLFTTFATARAPLLVAAFGLYMAGTIFWALRWRALLSIADVRPSLVEVWRITIEAQAGGLLLPAGVAGDALRVAYVREQKQDADLGKVIASIFADRIVGLSTLATLALIGALAFHIREAGPIVPILAAVPILSGAGFVVLRIPALRRSWLVENRFAAKIAKPMLEYVAAPNGPKTLLKSLFFSVFLSATQLAVVRCLLVAFDAPPTSEAWVVVGATLAFIVGALPGLPGAWGTADAAYVFFLGKAGISAPAAAAVCLMYRVCWYTLGMLGAISAVSRSSHRRRKP